MVLVRQNVFIDCFSDTEKSMDFPHTTMSEHIKSRNKKKKRKKIISMSLLAHRIFTLEIMFDLPEWRFANDTRGLRFALEVRVFQCKNGNVINF